MRVLVIGPDIEKSKGGMSTVIKEINEDKDLRSNVEIDIFSSYVDGNKAFILLYSFIAIVKFILFYRNYDVYHIHCASYGSTFRKGIYIYLVKLFNKKAILHIHGAEYLVFFEKSKHKNLIIKILNKADLVIALSNEWKRNFEKTFHIENCIAIENGIDVEKYSSCSGVKKNNYNIVMLGRLGTRKGTYDLINTIERVVTHFPNLKCYMAGDGEINKCITLIEKKNLKKNVFCLGWVNLTRKTEILKDSNILVLPSYNEGLPMAILEGMASGKAIISTNVGAIPEVISSEKNGILIHPGDIEALENAIIRLFTDYNLVKEMSKNNRKKIIEEFSTKKMHEEILKCYRKVFI